MMERAQKPQKAAANHWQFCPIDVGEGNLYNKISKLRNAVPTYGIGRRKFGTVKIQEN